MKFAFAILAAFALLLAGCASPQPAPGNNATACTAEAKVCPDGSTVGRIGPNCEFAACPTTPGASPPPAPPAPGNNATPPVPPGSLAPCMAGQAMMQGGCRPAISAAQLATHNTEADCWVGYDGKVYDISQFIPNHKNYRMLIVPLCGSSDQFKAKFEGKHGLSKVSFLESQPLMGALGQ